VTFVTFVPFVLISRLYLVVPAAAPGAFVCIGVRSWL